ncbi:MAG: hypothetical protein ACXW18_06310, partial [Pyrinomonadaceae bacterium]
MKFSSKSSRRYVSLICAIALFATSLAPVLAQQTKPAPAKQTTTTKRALTHQDYDSWRSINASTISRDGKFIAYAFMAQDNDSEIVVRNVARGTEWRAARGYRPPAPPPDDSIPNFGELIAAQGRLARPVFTADSRFVAFSIEPTKAELNKAKKDKKKPEDMPKNALGIMDLSSGQVAKVERVKNFQAPEDGSGFIAYLMEAKPAPSPNRDGARGPREGAPASETPATAPAQTGAAGAGTPAQGSGPAAREGTQGSSSSRSPAKKKEYGTDLVLRNTATGAERTFNDVLDYSLSKDAKTLAYTVASKNEETNGVYVAATQTDAAPVSLVAGKGKYQKLTWDEEQTELAFISDRDDAEAKQPKFKVYLWERGSGAVVKEGADRNHASGMALNVSEVVSASSPGFRKDFVVSEKASLGFSLDGARLFLGAAPPPEPEKNPDEEIPAEEKV